MRWFEGGIPAAIQTAKNQNSVFIVFISDENESSTQMEAHLHSEEVTQVCENGKCVAVKLQANSNDCKFFSQIYPVVVIPSTFFIANSGIPLEVVGEVKSQEDFTAKVKAALQKQAEMTKDEQPAAEGAIASPPSPPEPQMQKSENIPEESSPGPSTNITERAGSEDDTSPPVEKKPKEDLDTRVERAKELVELKKQEKMKKEAEEAKERERNRRSVGQGVQKLREQQKEQEILEAKKELMKNKEEDKLARQKVKDDIARDRAEKTARFEKEKADRSVAQEEARKRKMIEEQTALAAEQARRSDTARIQFRKPDGSSVTHQFPATENFSQLHQFITQHMGSNVSLSTTFPRRTFTIVDHNSTLQELGLAPSAAILVMPANMSTQGQRGGDSGFSPSNLFSLMLAPFVYIWNTIASLLGLSGSPALPASSQTSRPAPRSASATGGDRNQGSAAKRTSAPASSRQVGAIHRFHNAEDDVDPDDDSNTWNGNSTQQM